MPGDRKTRTTGIHGIHGRWIPETFGGVRWRWKFLWCWLMHVEWFPKLKHISGTMMVAQVVACINKLLVYERATALFVFFWSLVGTQKAQLSSFLVKSNLTGESTRAPLNPQNHLWSARWICCPKIIHDQNEYFSSSPIETVLGFIGEQIFMDSLK